MTDSVDLSLEFISPSPYLMIYEKHMMIPCLLSNNNITPDVYSCIFAQSVILVSGTKDKVFRLSGLSDRGIAKVCADLQIRLGFRPAFI